MSGDFFFVSINLSVYTLRGVSRGFLEIETFHQYDHHSFWIKICIAKARGTYDKRLYIRNHTQGHIETLSFLLLQ